MNLDHLIASLVSLREHMQKTYGVSGADIEAHLWAGDDTTPVTEVDHDMFEENGSWVVLIQKAGDP